MNTEQLSHMANASSSLSQAAKALNALGDNDVWSLILESMSQQLNDEFKTALENSEHTNTGKPTKESLPLILPARLSRIELIHHMPGDEEGRRYVTYRAQGAELSFQNGGRTLKMFVNDSGSGK